MDNVTHDNTAAAYLAVWEGLKYKNGERVHSYD